MKISHKLLIMVAGVLIALLVTGLVMLKQDVRTLMAQSGLENKFRAVPVEPFESLVFSSHWDVKIRQGRGHKVELAVNGRDEEASVLEHKGGTLYFNSGSLLNNNASANLQARITVPYLHQIRSVGDTRINIENFDLDSLTINIDDGGGFMGKNNQIENLSFTTSGKTKLEIIDDMDL